MEHYAHLFESYAFNIKSVFLYDPTLRPAAKKPSEEEIQDTKLLFYYPSTATIHDKRNQVGLAEGAYLFWESLNRQQQSQKDVAQFVPVQQSQQQLSSGTLDSTNIPSPTESKGTAVVHISQQSQPPEAQLNTDTVQLPKESSSDNGKKSEILEDVDDLQTVEQGDLLDFGADQSQSVPGVAGEQQQAITPSQKQEDLINFDNAASEDAEANMLLASTTWSQNMLQSELQVNQQRSDTATDTTTSQVGEIEYLEDYARRRQERRSQYSRSKSPNLKEDSGKVQQQEKKSAKSQEEEVKLEQQQQQQQQQQQTQQEAALQGGGGGDKGSAKKSTRDLSRNFQVNYLDQYIHIMREIEEDLWIYIVVKRFNTRQRIYRGVRQFSAGGGGTGNNNVDSQSSANDSSSDGQQQQQQSQQSQQQQQQQLSWTDQNCYVQEQIAEETLLRFCDHFNTTFQTFHGTFRSYFAREAREELRILFEQYIPRYQALNSFDTGATQSQKSNAFSQQMNFLAFDYIGLRYAPIDKSNFLTIQYLVNILSSINREIRHLMVFYAGYFLYSTVCQETAVRFFQYYYGCAHPFAPAEDKIATKFINVPEVRSLHMYGQFYNSSGLGQKVLNQAGNAQAQQKNVRAPNTPSSATASSTSAPLMQSVYIDGTPYSMSTVLQDRLLFVLLYAQDAEQAPYKQIEINAAILKNSERISKKLASSIQKVLQAEEPFTFVYYNRMNMAIKIPAQFISAKTLGMHDLELMTRVYNELQADSHAQQRITKSLANWILGLRLLDRVIVSVFPGHLTLPKVSEEMEKLKKSYMSQMFV